MTSAAAAVTKNQYHDALAAADPEVFAIIQAEAKRQREGLELIASENFTSPAVLGCLGSCLTNKYSEGLPGSRYYGGNEHIDALELLCHKRALEAFGLSASDWHVNVQPYSGSPANIEAYIGLLQTPHSRIMGLEWTSGGHLSHGFYTGKKKMNASSLFFEALPYRCDPETGYIDFDELQRNALVFRPKLIICGASSYPRLVDFAKFREIADSCGAMLMADISHISGLVAAEQHPSPWPYCDVVTTTTHKTLRGPRSAMIFTSLRRQGVDVANSIDAAVFPGMQGGPHNNQIAGVATQLKEVLTPAFREYAKQVVLNCKALAQELIEVYGQKLVTDGTDNHLLLWDLRKEKITGSKFERVAELVNVSVNKNNVPGDVSALNPTGVRIGTAAVTTRGCTAEDMKFIAKMLMRCLELSKKVQEKTGEKLVDFCNSLNDDNWPELIEIRDSVKKFAQGLNFPTDV